MGIVLKKTVYDISGESGEYTYSGIINQSGDTLDGSATLKDDKGSVVGSATVDQTGIVSIVVLSGYDLSKAIQALMDVIATINTFIVEQKS